MAKKKTTETQITITLTDTQGDFAYTGSATIRRGDAAHITQFEYFDLPDVTAVVERVLEQLAETHTNLLPATVRPPEPVVETEAEPEPAAETETAADPPEDTATDDETEEEAASPKDEQLTMF